MPRHDGALTADMAVALARAGSRRAAGFAHAGLGLGRQSARFPGFEEGFEFGGYPGKAMAEKEVEQQAQNPPSDALAGV